MVKKVVASTTLAFLFAGVPLVAQQQHTPACYRQTGNEQIVNLESLCGGSEQKLIEPLVSKEHQFIEDYKRSLMTSDSPESRIVETLRQASSGLLMPSESEYPFEVVHWEGQEELTDEKLLQLTGHLTDSPIETTTLDHLFRNVAQEKEWHDDVQKANVPRFQSLGRTLQENLVDIKVYRVGSIDIDVYIVGKTTSGDLAGLSTKVIETP